MYQNTDPHIYYFDCLNNNEETSKLFRKITIPSGIPFYFILATCLLFSFIELFVNLYFTTLFPCLLLCLEFYRIILLREAIFNHCKAMESLYQREWIENGVDPNYPYDPQYVIDSDREYIFYDCLMENTRDYRNFWKTVVKKRMLFILSIISLYFLFWLLGNFFLN
jgi:hypothetical protein